MKNWFLRSARTLGLHVAETISTINRATRRYEGIERHVKTVKMMYPMALHHGASYITAWLIRNRERFGRSGRWNTFYVREICRVWSRLDTSETRHGRHGETMNLTTKIIDDELWLLRPSCRVKLGKAGVVTPKMP